MPRQPSPIDPTDLKLLKLLQTSPELTNLELASKVGMAASAVHGRLSKLKRAGILRAEVRLDAKKLGFGLVAFVFVREDKSRGVPNTVAALSKIPEIQAIFHVAGEDCFLLRVCAPDTNALGKLVRQTISRIKGVAGTRSSIVLETYKDSNALPLDTTLLESEK